MPISWIFLSSRSVTGKTSLRRTVSAPSASNFSKIIFGRLVSRCLISLSAWITKGIIPTLTLPSAKTLTLKNRIKKITIKDVFLRLSGFIYLSLFKFRWFVFHCSDTILHSLRVTLWFISFARSLLWVTTTTVMPSSWFSSIRSL